ncbi:MBL fold metallo-hydrolase [Caballeronia novacaledonica]|uniref:MBL fold metallo-hydrolase n=1 Tax=Caballeronia novacaledonica TaxID=1544861 RepID=UPI001EE3382E|nr:MBL fold metallo-hydrolase [Caballeronia novacaledonica]GJH14176.1 MBL fold metallo-hydrolase [Caballeronia novacaledonica]
MTADSPATPRDDNSGGEPAPKYQCIRCTGPFAAVPETSLGRPPGPQGYHLEAVKPGIFWISAGGYDTMFIVTEQGVIVIDAPPALRSMLVPAIQSVTSQPVTHVIYSHSHFDHIGAADIYPADAVRIAQENTATTLQQYQDHRRPLPTITFVEEHTLEVGGSRLELRYRGNIHQPGNIFIYESRQKVLMLVDVIFPGWVPFRNLAVANDVHEYLRAHDLVLTYDFDVMVCGHLTRHGTRADVETQREYVQQLRTASRKALATVRIEEVATRTGTENIWALMNGYFEDAVDAVTRDMLTTPTSDGRLWTERLGGADVWTPHHAFSMIQALRVENPD